MRISLSLKQARFNFLKTRFNALKRETRELAEQFSALKKRIREARESGADLPEVPPFPGSVAKNDAGEAPSGHAS